MSIYFDEIFKPQLKGLVRGVFLDDFVEEQILTETGNTYDSKVQQIFTCTQSIIEDSELLYNVHYYYDEHRKITKISISAKFNQDEINILEISDFLNLIDEIQTYLERQFGVSQSEKRKQKFYGQERIDTWSLNNKHLKIIKITFDDPRNRILKAFRIDYLKL